jgi:hypothetical protein
VKSYASDTQACDLITKLSLQGDSVPHFSLHNGVLRYKNRVWIGLDNNLHLQIIAAMHSNALGGHSGFSVTYSRLKKYFHWTGMKSEVKSFVQNCQICQQAKAERVCYPGLL